jgi:hypothetical protein
MNVASNEKLSPLCPVLEDQPEHIYGTRSGGYTCKTPRYSMQAPATKAPRRTM